jgi:HAD superfamily hydrolase (TIGR01509 family)
MQPEVTKAPRTTCLSPIRAVIFDLDGTLFDTEHYGVNCLLDALQRQRPAINKQQLLQVWLPRCYGRALTVIYDELSNEYHLERNQLIADYNDYWQASIDQNLWLSGSQELLKNLQIANIPVALCTGSEREQVLPLLTKNHALQYFKQLVTNNDYHSQHSKPHPRPYQITLEKMQAAPAETLVFEDSVAGVTAAKAAGINAIIGRATQHEHRQALLAAGARWITDHLNNQMVKTLIGL